MPQNRIENARRILVVRQHDQLGDMLVAVPLLRALRKKFPDSLIAVVARPKNAAPLRHHPYIDRLFVFDKERFWSAPAELRRFFLGVRDFEPDVAIVPFTNSFSTTSSLIAFASGAPVRIGVRRIGAERNALSGLCTHTVDLDWSADPHRHQTLRNLDAAGSLALSTDDLRHEIGFSAEELESGRRAAEEIRSSRPSLVGLHVGGKATNRWPAERFAAVADRLRDELGAAVFLTSGPVDSGPVARFLAASCERPALVHGLPLRPVAAIIHHASLYLTNDTGMMHVAASTGCPTLSLFGPTDPLQWAPLGDSHRYLLSPSGTMLDLSLDDVFEAAGDMLRVRRDPTVAS